MGGGPKDNQERWPDWPVLVDVGGEKGLNFCFYHADLYYKAEGVLVGSYSELYP